MSMQNLGMRAYTNALENFSKAEKRLNEVTGGKSAQNNDFAEVLKSSLDKVNDLQSERSQLVSSFASGENQNVHELMISMQKAGVAMNMTAAVRNKVMEAYKELTRLQF